MTGGRATAGQLPKDALWPVARPTPDVRLGKARTNNRNCGIQPAHHSLITDVFRFCLPPCTINDVSTHRIAVEKDVARTEPLTTDITASPHDCGCAGLSATAGSGEAYCPYARG